MARKVSSKWFPIKINKFSFVTILFYICSWAVLSYAQSPEQCNQIKQEVLKVQGEQYSTTQNCSQPPTNLDSMPSEDMTRLKCLGLAQLQREHDEILAQMNLIHGLKKIKDSFEQSAQNVLAEINRQNVQKAQQSIDEIKKKIELVSMLKKLSSLKFKNSSKPSSDPSKTENNELGLTESYALLLLAHFGAGQVPPDFSTFIKTFCTNIKNEIDKDSDYAKSLTEDQKNFCQKINDPNNLSMVNELSTFATNVILPLKTLDATHPSNPPRFNDISGMISELSASWVLKSQDLVSKFDLEKSKIDNAPKECFLNPAPSGSNCREFNQFRTEINSKINQIKATRMEADNLTYPLLSDPQGNLATIKENIGAQLEIIKNSFNIPVGGTPTASEVEKNKKDLAIKGLNENIIPVWKEEQSRVLKDLALETNSMDSTSRACQQLPNLAQTSNSQKPLSIDEIGAQNRAGIVNCRAEDPAFYDRLKKLQDHKLEIWNNQRLNSSDEKKKVLSDLKNLGLCPQLDPNGNENDIKDKLKSCVEASDFTQRKNAKYNDLENKLKTRQNLMAEIKNKNNFKLLERAKMLSVAALRRVCRQTTSTSVYAGGCSLKPNDTDLKNMLYLLDEGGSVLAILSSNEMNQDFRDICYNSIGDRIPKTCDIHQDWRNARLEEKQRQIEAKEEKQWRQDRREFKRKLIERRVERMKTSYFNWQTGERSEFHPGSSILSGAMEGLKNFASSGVIENLGNLYVAHDQLYAQAQTEIQLQNLYQQQQNFMIANGIYPYGPIGAPSVPYPNYYNNGSVNGYPMILPRQALTPGPATLASGGRPDLFTNTGQFQYQAGCAQGLALCI